MKRTDPRWRLLERTAWALACLALFSAPAARAEVLYQDLSFPGLEISRDESGGWSALYLPGGIIDVPFGEPMVPSVEVVVELPAGRRAAAVDLDIVTQEQQILPRPVQRYGGEEAVDSEPNEQLVPEAVPYAHDDYFPQDWVRLVSTVEMTTGARYAVVRVNPVRVWPFSGQLQWVRSARLAVELEAGQPGMSLPRKRALAEGGPVAPAGRLLLLEGGIAPRETPSLEGSPIEYAILCPPDDNLVAAWQPLVDWKIATGHPAQIFTTDWIEEHYPNGADLQERIRLFLQDAYTYWGLRWVLIGCDADRIPTRYAISMAFNQPDGTLIATDYYYACLEGNWDADGDGVFGESSSAGEPDWADTTPEIHVGRVSARSADEVEAFLDKYFTYVRTPPVDGYLDRYLLLGEVLFHAQWSLSGLGSRPDCHGEECGDTLLCRRIERELVCVTMDGAADCFKLQGFLADSLGLESTPTLLLERAEYWNETQPGHEPDPILESGASVLEHINQGYAFVHQVGHGDRGLWAVGNGRLQAIDIAAFTNGDQDHYFWALASNCYSAAVDYDCIGERMILYPGQGAVAYMGCTNAEFPGTAYKFVDDTYRFMYEADGRTIGDGFYGGQGANALTGSLANSEYGYTRFLLYGQLLIGEPDMVVWRGTPDQATVEIVDHTNRQVPLGTASLTIAVHRGEASVAGARVCVHKAGEVYAVGETGASGEVTLPFWPETTGSFTLGVMPPGCQPALFEDAQVTAAESGPALLIDAVTVVDDGTLGSDGNANGQIEMGEGITFSLALVNLGSTAATDVTAVLRPGADVPAGAFVVGDSSAYFASIPSGGSPVTIADAFSLDFAAQPPEEVFDGTDSRRLPFTIVLKRAGEESPADLALELTRPRLAIAPNRQVDGPGNGVDFWVGLANSGKGAASHLTATLTSLNVSSISIEGGASASLAVGDIAPGDTALAGPFSLLVYSDLGRLRVEVVADGRGLDTLHVREMDLRGPGAPAGLTLIGLPQAMHVTWTEPTDAGGDGILGYKVFRAEGVVGPFEDAFDGVLEGHRFFEDSGLAELAQYSYYVAAVDSGGNVGTSAAAVAAYTCPGQSDGWPNQLENDTEASPLICELDGWAGPGWGREVLFGGETMYAFHSDGSEVIDGDHLERTRGPFSLSGDGCVGLMYWARAAVGDVDGDGENEVVAAAANRTTDKVPPAGARGEIVCWGPWGRTPEWVHTMVRCRAWTTPCLYDLDGDGKLETVFLAGDQDHAGIYVLNEQGLPEQNTDPSTGLLRDLGGTNLYQRPAIGDVDGNGQPDITVATRTSNLNLAAIHVVRPDGAYVTGFSGQAGHGLTFAELGKTNQSTTGSASLYDVDGTPGDEIFVVTPNRLWCVKRNGGKLWSLDFNRAFNIDEYQILPEPALGDINGDDQADVALVDAAHKLHVLRGAAGTEISPFPVQLETGDIFYGSCILANVDENPEPEIIFGDSQQRIHAYTYQGQIARGFPIHFGGKFTQQSLAAWDIDEDGYQNLVVQVDESQKLGAYDMRNSPFPSDPEEQARQNPWPMRNRDPWNTGRLTSSPPVAVQVLAETPTVTSEGEVMLRWASEESVSLFRIRRARTLEEPAALLAEVPAEPGQGLRRYAYTDRPAETGVYVYRINPVTLAGQEETGPVLTVQVSLAGQIRFGLHRVAPDPLTPGRVATIVFGIPHGTPAETVLRVFDLQGRLVARLVDEAIDPGAHEVTWDGRDLAGRPVPTGLYLLRLDADSQVANRRLLVVR
jgi:hypothetical protein